MTHDMGLLLERLRGAKGADRDIDTDIHWLFSDWENIGGGWVKHKVTGERERTTYAAHPAVTASIDAALALTERLLPGWQWCLNRNGRPMALVNNGPGHQWECDRAATMPLAILTALLTALSTKEG